MTAAKCPGQDPMFMTSQDVAEVKCPGCGHVVEFWPDELVRKCRNCGRRVANPTDSMKCLEWCRHAAQCMAALHADGDGWMEPLRAELIARMKAAFGHDTGRVEHTMAVLELAEKIGREVAAEPVVLVPAAILHDIGRARSSGGSAHNGEEGRRMAAELLNGLTLPGAVREMVLDLVECHHDRDRMRDPSGSALFDADLIVNLREEVRRDRQDVLAREALTDAGRRIGAAVLNEQPVARSQSTGRA